MYMSRRVGWNARRERLNLGIPIRVVVERAADLGWTVHQSALSRLETGETRVSVDELAVLAEILDVPVAALLEPADATAEDRWQIERGRR